MSRPRGPLPSVIRWQGWRPVRRVLAPVTLILVFMGFTGVVTSQAYSTAAVGRNLSSAHHASQVCSGPHKSGCTTTTTGSSHTRHPGPGVVAAFTGGPAPRPRLARAPRPRPQPPPFQPPRHLRPRHLRPRRLPPRHLPPRHLPPRHLRPRHLPPRHLPPRHLPPRRLPPRRQRPYRPAVAVGHARTRRFRRARPPAPRAWTALARGGLTTTPGRGRTARRPSTCATSPAGTPCRTSTPGQVETYPNSEYDIAAATTGCRPKPPSTSSPREPRPGSWSSNWGTEIMV